MLPVSGFFCGRNVERRYAKDAGKAKKKKETA